MNPAAIEAASQNRRRTLPISVIPVDAAPLPWAGLVFAAIVLLCICCAGCGRTAAGEGAAVGKAGAGDFEPPPLPVLPPTGLCGDAGDAKARSAAVRPQKNLAA